MSVRMVHVRYVSVSVLQPFVAMPVGVRLTRGIIRSMRVSMVLVVHVRVCMLHRLMHVLMLVILG
jgi:hypothetical protein